MVLKVWMTSIFDGSENAISISHKSHNFMLFQILYYLSKNYAVIRGGEVGAPSENESAKRNEGG